MGFKNFALNNSYTPKTLPIQAGVTILMFIAVFFNPVLVMSTYLLITYILSFGLLKFILVEKKDIRVFLLSFILIPLRNISATIGLIIGFFYFINKTEEFKRG